jgi:hypothetical protein
MRKGWILLAAFVMALSLGLSACSEGDSSERHDAHERAEQNRADFVPYIPHNQIEGSNYNRKEELFDDPNTIIWCSAFPPGSNYPVITIPIAGKLTSSSVSVFPSDKVEHHHGDAVVEAEDVDGLFHGTPPPYRYGFTPGGQYVSFEGQLATLCTTQPLEIQRQSVSVKVAGGLNKAQKEAEAALRNGNGKEAQEILGSAAGE